MKTRKEEITEAIQKHKDNIDRIDEKVKSLTEKKANAVETIERLEKEFSEIKDA